MHVFLVKYVYVYGTRTIHFDDHAIKNTHIGELKENTYDNLTMGKKVRLLTDEAKKYWYVVKRTISYFL